MIDGLDTTGLGSVILHGDFASWNLLFDESGFSGLLDFEFTHRGFRISDFAMAWRGDRDEIIQGYQEISPLNDIEHALIVPCFWACLLNDVAEKIEAFFERGIRPDWTWEKNKLLVRSKRFGIDRYPGR